jgi:hypothetical protein
MWIKFEAKSCELYRTKLMSFQLNIDLKQTHSEAVTMCLFQVDIKQVDSLSSLISTWNKHIVTASECVCFRSIVSWEDYRPEKKTHCYSLRMCAVECRLTVFENRVPRRIFRNEEKEMTRGWRKLHCMELHNLYFHQTVLEWPNQERWNRLNV